MPILTATSREKAFEEKLNTAKAQKFGISRQLGIFECQVLDNADDVDVLYARYSQLMSHQPKLLNLGVLDIERAKHETHQDPYPEAFRNAWLLATCDQLFHTLPSELRDMVYAHLMRDVEFEFNTEKASNDPGRLQWNLPHSKFGASYHCLHSNLVGPDMFRELIQTLYREIHVTKPLITESDLSDFLSRDAWNLNLRPFDYIRLITLNVHESSFSSTKLQQDLSSLSQLKPGAKLHITLRCIKNADPYKHGYKKLRKCHRGCRKVAFYSHSNKDVRAFFEVLWTLRSTLKRVVDAGVRLDVVFLTCALGLGAMVTWLYRHGQGVGLDVDVWIVWAMERKRVSIWG